MPRSAGPDPEMPFIVSAERALAAGLTRDQVRQRVRSGRWSRLAHGVYRRNDVAAPMPEDIFARARREHAELAVARALALPGTIIAGMSAAAVHDIPIVSEPPDRVCLVRPGTSSIGRKGAGIRGWPIGPQDVLATSPRVTKVPRTWFDVARTGTLADALCAGDFLLRHSLAICSDLSNLAESSARHAARARTALQHLHADRESPLESASWAYFVSHRLPLPQMQVTLRTSQGRFIGRVDFLWPQARLVGECDGRGKYQTSGDLFAEKLREDELRAEGFRVVRWGFQHLRTGELAARLRNNIAIAS